MGRDMTLMLISGAKDMPQELYLTACKNAIATGDSVRAAALPITRQTVSRMWT